jgi:hypothetical protein
VSSNRRPGARASSGSSAVNHVETFPDAGPPAGRDRSRSPLHVLRWVGRRRSDRRQPSAAGWGAPTTVVGTRPAHANGFWSVDNNKIMVHRPGGSRRWDHIRVDRSLFKTLGRPDNDRGTFTGQAPIAVRGAGSPYGAKGGATGNPNPDRVPAGTPGEQASRPGSLTAHRPWRAARPLWYIACGAP